MYIAMLQIMGDGDYERVLLPCFFKPPSSGDPGKKSLLLRHALIFCGKYGGA